MRGTAVGSEAVGKVARLGRLLLLILTLTLTLNLTLALTLTLPLTDPDADPNPEVARVGEARPPASRCDAGPPAGVVSAPGRTP